MKKITSVAALLLAIIMLASCGMGAPAENPENEIRTTITGFLDAIFDMDFEKAKTYAMDDDTVSDLAEKLSIDKMTEAFESTAGSIMSEEKIASLLSGIAKKLFKTLKYEITDVTIEGDTAEAAISLSYPDYGSIDMQSEDIDYASMMQEAFGFDMNDAESFLKMYADRKGMTTEELMAKFAGGDQADVMSDLIDTFEPEFEKMFDIMGDKMVELGADKIVTDDGTVNLEKDSDNTWKITKVD